MFRERARLVALGLLALDLIAVSAAFFLAYWLRSALFPALGWSDYSLYELRLYLPLLPLSLMLWLAALLAFGRYRAHQIPSLQREIVVIARACALAGLLLVGTIYAFRLDARLLAGNPAPPSDSAVTAPRILQRDADNTLDVRWQARAAGDSGWFRLYAGPDPRHLTRIAEQPARAGVAEYTFQLPAGEASALYFELRFATATGQEISLERAIVHDRISRWLIFLFCVLSAVVLWVETVALQRVGHSLRQSGRGYLRAVIVGDSTGVKEVSDAISRHPHWGLQVLGFVSTTEDDPGDSPVARLGHFDDLLHIVERETVDFVLFAVGRSQLDAIENAFLALEEVGIKTCLALNLFPRSRAHAELAEIGGMPVLTFVSGPVSQSRLVVKRAIDLLAAGSLLVLLSPLVLVIGLLVKATSRGPVLFRQQRCGLNGRRFTLYKFRTMVADAEARRSEVAHLNEMDGPVFKARDDPRVTALGRVLRRLSLDELPQLWNVLRGDMSLVGPRPPIPAEVEDYARWQRRRLSMKPGLTCLWQVSGRNEIDFERWMELDLEYIDTWSLRLDLAILLKTIPVVVTGRGAS